MITPRIRPSAVTACLVGLAAIACATRLNLEHAANSDPASPIGSAIVVFGLLTAACAIAAPKAWAEGRKILTGMIILAAIAGEVFGLSAAVERMATLRAEQDRLKVSANMSRQLAADALTNARLELTEAARKATEATRGGCGRECLALRDVEANARQRVVDAEKTLGDLGAERPTVSPLAKILNLDATHLEIGLSALFGLALTLGGAGLLAFGAYNPGHVEATLVHERSHSMDTPDAGTAPLVGIAPRTLVGRTSNTQTHDRTPNRTPEGPHVGTQVPAPSNPPSNAATSTQQPGHPDVATRILDLAKASNGRLDKSVRGLAALIGKPKSTVHSTLTGLVAAGVLSKAGDGAGYVLASLR